MDSNKRILISGYYGFDNSGDDAILRAMVKDLRSDNNSIDITVLSNNPMLTEKAYNIRAINRFKILDVVRAIRNCNLFISGGGSLLQDVTSTRSLLYYLTLLKLANQFKKPIMIYANGIGPINKKLNRFLTKNILNKVDLITLRDEDSKEYLKYLGVNNENIYVTADPAFTLDPDDDWLVHEILAKEGIPRDRPLVGVSIRSWINENNLVSSIAKSIDYMTSQYKVNVILIPMHYPDDLIIGKKVLKKIYNNNCFLLSNKYNVEDIMGIIRELEMIIAMRLHSLIYAATQNTPMLGIAYDPKIEGFLNSIGMDYMCQAKEINYTELIYGIDYIWNNRERLRHRLKDIYIKMREEALRNANMALDLLQK